jgi:glycosyltransferase involved in cell wall biosynthesis
MNKFKIIVTSYNNEEWTETCLSSLLVQTYTNFDVIFFDDCSTDKTLSEAYNTVNCDKRFKIINLKENHTKSKIFATLINQYINDDDIILFLDGDDWLSNSEVLESINQFYELYDPWVSYGGMVVWNGGDNITEPFPQNSEFPRQVLGRRLYRQDTWRSSHAKTMKGFIWNSIDKTDFLSKQDGKYILGGDDLAFMFPALELCPPNKIGRFGFSTYVYNATNQQRICDHMHIRGVNYESEIRSRPTNSLLPIITSELSGGLGNQLFQISATISLANKLGYTAMFDTSKHILPLQGRNIKTYKNNLFRNVVFSKDLFIKNEYIQPEFNYTEFPNIQPFTILKGGYQSEKYINKNLILDLFSVSEANKVELFKKYGNVFEKTSVHIRRGDYLKLYPHHIFVGEDYYTKAINKINSDKYLVFSDDLEWCKSFFTGKQFDFVSDEDYNELYLMSLCKNNIIGNSTFSWWGAWLNQNPNKKVIAPNTWFGPRYSHFNTSDLIPNDWIKLTI